MKAQKRRNLILAIAAAVITIMFTSDALRTKYFGLPPVFCIPSEYLSDGVSRDYYGLGYKIWQDADPFDSSVDYRISLWILPKAFNI